MTVRSQHDRVAEANSVETRLGSRLPKVTRRRLITAVTALTLTSACRISADPAAPRSPRIGVLSSTQSFYESIRADLLELGYEEGRNLEILRSEVVGDDFTGPATEFVALSVDVIVTEDSPATEAAKNATSVIPIVFGLVHDPVQRGFAASLSRPGGNITGIGVAGLEETSKRIEIFREALPAIRRPILVYRDDDPTEQRLLEPVMRVGTQLGLELVPAPFARSSSPARVAKFLEAAGAATASGADSLIVLGPAPEDRAGTILGFLAARRLPSIGADAFVEKGALMGYGFGAKGSPVTPATLVDKVLRGSAPGELPIYRNFNASLILNLRTAAALGVSIAPSILANATRIIR